MEGFGIMREKLDIKILLLFILRRLPGKVSGDTLTELACENGRVGYFEYAECLSDLVDTGHVLREKNEYSITEKGIHDVDVVESSLAYTTRMRLTQRIEPIAEQMRRRAMIKAEHHTDKDGCQVELAMSDGISDVIELRLYCGSEENAAAIERNFRENAENYYNRIMEMLLHGEGTL